jgi:hypothetical protein
MVAINQKGRLMTKTLEQSTEREARDFGNADILKFMNSEEVSYIAVGKRGTMSLPAAIRKRFRLDSPGAQLRVSVRDDNVIELRPYLAIPADQAWYWTPEWQAKERQADDDISQRHTTVFGSDEEFDAWLGDH